MTVTVWGIYIYIYIYIYIIIYIFDSEHAVNHGGYIRAIGVVENIIMIVIAWLLGALWELDTFRSRKRKVTAGPMGNTFVKKKCWSGEI